MLLQSNTKNAPKTGRLIIGLLIFALSLVWLVSMSTQGALAATTSCTVYTFGEKASSTCDTYKIGSDHPCDYFATTSDGGHQDTTCYSPTFYTCQVQSGEIDNCQVKSGAKLPPWCPSSLGTSNQSLCRLIGTESVGGGGAGSSSSTTPTGTTDCPNLAGSTGVKCIDRATDDSCAGTTSENPCGLTEKYINPLINLLAGAVGIVVVIMLIIGGIEYSTAGGDPARVASARKRIFNAVFALVVFLFLFAILSWIVPGGFIQ